MKGAKRMPRVKSAKDFAQYDSRWGSKGYPKKPYTMAGNGCGPTSCADIIVTNPKYRKITPDTIRKWMIKHGYAVAGHGTAWAGISACLKAFGFKVTNHPTMKEFFAEMAKEGRCGIILFRAGTRGGVTWTTGGHFVSVSGYKYKNKKHYLYINDPYRRHHDGWYCYETTMKGLIPQVWSCYLPAEKKTEKKKAKKEATAEKTYSGTLPTGTLKAGSSGSSVKKWQKFMIWMGEDLKADGKFGAMTRRATIDVQKKLHVTADGIVGPATLLAAKKYHA
jgi:hypothetical protein